MTRKQSRPDLYRECLVLDEKPTQGVHCNKPGGLEKREQGAVVDRAGCLPEKPGENVAQKAAGGGKKGGDPHQIWNIVHVSKPFCLIP